MKIIKLICAVIIICAAIYSMNVAINYIQTNNIDCIIKTAIGMIILCIATILWLRAKNRITISDAEE